MPVDPRQQPFKHPGVARRPNEEERDTSPGGTLQQHGIRIIRSGERSSRRKRAGSGPFREPPAIVRSVASESSFATGCIPLVYTAFIRA